MNNRLKQYTQRFDAQTIRERGLIAFSAIFATAFLWWSYYAEPMRQQIEIRQQENLKISTEIENTRAIVRDIRKRISAGVHQEKESRLAGLIQELSRVEEQLRVKTVELIDPEKMFDLMAVEPGINDAPDAKALVVERGGLEFDVVSFSYRPDRQILKDVSIRVRPGQEPCDSADC